MSRTIDARERALRTALARAGQVHLSAALDRLEPERRGKLLAEIEALDLELVAELARAIPAKPPVPRREDFAPADVFPLARDARTEARARDAARRGVESLSRGEVAWLLVAGGQASRLGLDIPKGAFPVGPVSGRSLFEIFARKLRAARERHSAAIPWYVMTSQANDAATREYFALHDHFGLEPEDVFFFRQGMLPALDPEGRLLLAAPDRLFLAPNGHGGLLSALLDSGALADARGRGVKTFSYFQVDNALARPADPLFLGLHAAQGAQMSSKVVKKRDHAEKVGVIGRVAGRLACIEYSDMPADLRESRTPQGHLVFGAGNVAMHAIELDFAEKLVRGGLKLPWHLARKDVEALDEQGRPGKRPGIKFETFVFDALGCADRSVTLEVDRAVEFSPVKNAQGEDSPVTARADQCRLFAGWVEGAGLPLPAAEPDGIRPVEVDPLLAEDRETFVSRAPRAPEVSERGHLYV